MYSTMLMCVLVTGAETPSWGYGGYGSGCGWYSSYSYYGGGYPWYGYGSYSCYPYYGGYSYGYGSYSCYPYYGYGSYPSYLYSSYPTTYPYSSQGTVPQVTVEPVAPKPQDPLLTPRTTEEEEAVRKLLDSIRKKANAPPANAARIVVRLPADARLFVDDVLMGTGTRSFNTPALKDGRDYFYILRVDRNRGGQTVSDSRRVTFSAGKQIEVDFGSPATAAR